MLRMESEFHAVPQGWQVEALNGLNASQRQLDVGDFVLRRVLVGRLLAVSLNSFLRRELTDERLCCNLLRLLLNHGRQEGVDDEPGRQQVAQDGEVGQSGPYQDSERHERNEVPALFLPRSPPVHPRTDALLETSQAQLLRAVGHQYHAPPRHTR